MVRLAYLAIAVLCYFAFFVSFVYFVGFVGACPALPTHIDKGSSASPGVAAIIDLALIALFGVQHSVMARPGFKAAWTRIVPAPLERSTYCLASAIALGVLFAFWHPIAGTVWHVTSPSGRAVLWGLFWTGFGVVFISTWLINHFELFGLAQAWRHFRDVPAPPGQFRTPMFYRAVRHPIYTGFTLSLWATPDMTVGHLLFAVAMTAYVLVGIRYEERDLIAHFGRQYAQYRTRVGMIVPWLGRASPD